MTLRLNSTGGGFVEADAPNIAGNYSLTLPTADGSAGQVLSTNGAGALSFVNAIAEVDQWYLTADQSADGVVTDFTRNNHEAATQIGTGMSISSGIFTFPVTGKWLVIAAPMWIIDLNDSVVFETQVTLDNSTYNTVVRAADGHAATTGNARNGGAASFAFLDITDTSLRKVRFNLNSAAAGTYLAGNTAFMETHVVFIRLGDT